MEDNLIEALFETEVPDELENLTYYVLDDPGLVHYTQGLFQIFANKKDTDGKISELEKSIGETIGLEELIKRVDQHETKIEELTGLAQELEELI